MKALTGGDMNRRKGPATEPLKNFGPARYCIRLALYFHQTSQQVGLGSKYKLADRRLRRLAKFLKNFAKFSKLET